MRKNSLNLYDKIIKYLHFLYNRVAVNSLLWNTRLHRE